jgi:hypothetical protein
MEMAAGETHYYMTESSLDVFRNALAVRGRGLRS